MNVTENTIRCHQGKCWLQKSEVIFHTSRQQICINIAKNVYLGFMENWGIINGVL